MILLAEKKKTILDENVLSYRYVLKECNVNIPGEKPIPIRPMQISNFMIEKDFQFDYFPIFKLTCHFEPLLMEKIVKNRAKVTFHVRLQKKPSNSNNLKEMPAKDVFNKTFAVFMEDASPFFNKRNYLMYYGGKEVKPSNMHPRDFGSPTDFYLFPEKELTASKKMSNIIFGSTNMTDAIVYVLGSAGFSNILMAPLDNSGSYKQVILPNYTSLETLEYLENVYGFYNDGSMIFFDYDRGYVIPSNVQCKAWVKQEYKEVVMINKAANNPTVMPQGSLEYSKEKKFIINVPPRAITINSASIIGDHISGNKIEALDNRSGSITTAAGKTQQRGSGNTRMVINKYGNKFVVNAMAKARTAGEKLATINLMNHDIDIFKPNRSYKLIFEQGSLNSDAGGQYMLTKLICSFEKAGHDTFTLNSAVYLSK